MTPTKTYRAWAALWRSRNRLDGERRFLMIGLVTHPRLFRTRADCRSWVEREHGYIRKRPDLQREPHGWKMPAPVRVTVTIQAEESKP